METGKRRPLLADGSIVPDYEPLFKYWELAREKSKELADRAVLTNNDFVKLGDVVREASYEGRKITVHDLLTRFTREFAERIDPKLAREALLKARGVEMEEEDARREIARIMSGWLIEAGKAWGLLRLVGSLPES